MEGTCYGVTRGFSNRLCTQDRRGGRLWGQAVGAGGQSWESSALYCSVRPAEETSDVAYYRTTHVFSRGLSSVRP